MSLDFWWGALAGAIAMVILGFALCALLTLILYRWVWIPNAEVEARTYTGEDLEQMLRDP
ncbi:MAG: hypothetical protein HIU88_10165 [Acidobacteria bacterium]|nr:hypothetical protein [Acidobacteriota bacterium]